MAYFKEVKGEYLNSDSVENVINYICNPYKTPSGLIGGLSVVTTSIDDIIMQFKTVKEIYHKEGGKQIRHFVLSFSPYKQFTEQQLMQYGMWIASYYANDYQIVYAVHEDKIYQHIHFIMNSVSFRNGKKYVSNRADYEGLMEHVYLVTNLTSLQCKYSDY